MAARWPSRRWPGAGRQTRCLGRPLAAAALLLLTSPSYFGHYGTFAAPALALVVGAGTDTVLSWLAVRAPVVRPLVPALGLVALAVLGAHVVPQPEGRRPPPESAMADELSGPAASRPTARPPSRSRTSSAGTCGTAARWSST